MARKRKGRKKAKKAVKAGGGTTLQRSQKAGDTAQKSAGSGDDQKKKRRSKSRRAFELLPIQIVPTGRKWIAAIVIMLITVGVYWNIQTNEFLRFDDRKYIYENSLVRGDEGLGAIWTDIWNDKPKVHYNPMTYSTFWIEHALVGLEPAEVDPDQVVGQAAHPLYHWTQILLHGCNSILVMLVLLALGISFPAASLTALIFAIHPINVESVAWTAERKNLLSGLFFWLTLFTYIFHRRRSESPQTAGRRPIPMLYITALIMFALALLSKTASVVAAPMLILTDRLLDNKWTWASLKRAVPFFLMGAVMAFMMTSREDALGTKNLEHLAVQFKPFVAVSAVVHYVGKMFLPVDLTLIYPRWNLSLSEPRYWISMAVVVLGFILVFRYRARLGDFWLWGLGLFLITVAPVLGLIRFAWMQFSFVSDHYMYYGSVGIILMVVLLGEKIVRPLNAKSPKTVVLAVFCLAGLICCGVLTIQQNRVWRDNVTLWTHNFSINPDAFQGHITLAGYHTKKGNLEKAYFHRLEFARIMNFSRSWRTAAQLAWKLGLKEEALLNYEKAIQADKQKKRFNWGIHTEYARSLAKLGRLDDAIREYRMVLRKKPRNANQLKKEMARLRNRQAASSANN